MRITAMEKGPMQGDTPGSIPGEAVKKRGIEPRSRAVFIHGSDLSDGVFAVFEEKRTSAVAGVAYPTKDSRSAAACERALGITTDCFLDRPNVTDMALHMISSIVDEAVGGLQENDAEYMCSLAALYIFKGKARVCPAGYSAVLFFEEGELKSIWYGDGVPVGGGSHEGMALPEDLQLDADCRFVFIAGSDMETVKEAVEYTKDSRGEDTEGMKAYFAERHAAYVNLYLPRREKRGFFR